MYLPYLELLPSASLKSLIYMFTLCVCVCVSWEYLDLSQPQVEQVEVIDDVKQLKEQGKGLRNRQV